MLGSSSTMRMRWAIRPRSEVLLQLLQDRRILQLLYVLRDLLALGDRAQEAPHDLPGARLGQVVAEADVLRLGDRADLLADPLAQLLGDLERLVTRGSSALQHHEGAHRLAGQLVRAADDRGLGHELRVGHQRALDLHRAQAVAGDVQHVVDAAHDGYVAVLVAGRAVAREVVLALELLGVVALLEALGVAPDGADHRRPRALDHQDAALALADRVTGLVDDIGDDARQRRLAGAGLQGVHAGERRDHVAAGLGLPPGVDDRAAAVADRLVVPAPGLRVDRLAHGAEDAQRLEVVFPRQLAARL